MSWGAQIWRWVAVGAVAVAGVVGTGVALGSRDSDSEFLLRQKNPPRLSTADIEGLVRKTAPSPAPGHPTNATRASCRPGSRTGLKNPWSCTLQYPDGLTAAYSLSFRGDGSYVGRDLAGTGIIRGCCIAVPGG